MAIKIIADSCCDTTPEIREKYDISLVPLILKIPGYGEIRDTLDVDTQQVVDLMAASSEPVRSACPSVEDYAQVMRQYDECVVVTLSQKLSGSYNSARVAGELVCKEHPEKKVHVFDSQSAASGELLIVMHIDSLRAQGLPFEQVVQQTEDYIRTMRTFFVLEDLMNLVKNGRMSKVKGIVASVLSIHPVLADNGDGEIVSLHTVRGLANSLTSLVNSVKEQLLSKLPKSIPLVMTQCLCPDRALSIRESLLRECPALSDVTIVPASGLSTIYANKGGIILAFNPA